MNIMPWIAIILLSLPPLAFADDQQQITQGAQDYDWQACLNDKISDCANDCTTSEEVDCTDNCQSLAADKCQSEGLTPPAN